MFVLEADGGDHRVADRQPDRTAGARIRENVIGVDIRDVPATATVQRVVPPDMLDSVLPEADVVFMSVPHTTKTEGMIGVAGVRPDEGADRNFIAMSRGKVYDQGRLIKRSTASGWRAQVSM